MISVGLVDDHEVIRSGMREFLKNRKDIQVVAEASDGIEAIRMVRDQRIDVVVLDLNMPKHDGVTTLAGIRAASPSTGVLIFSGMPAENYAVNLIKLGARGYLTKDSSPEEVVEALYVIAQGRLYLPPTIADLLAKEVLLAQGSLPHERLGRREFEVVMMLARGRDVTSIGKELGLSPKTVTTYRTRALIKLNAKSNSELTYYAVKHKLIK